MPEFDSKTLTKNIIHSLNEQGVDPDVILKIKEAITLASIRPLRVLYECVVAGSISTEQLTKKYGYNQPPRAARDLREMGFSLETSFSKTADGRRMAVYSISDFSSFNSKKGRTIFTKKEKQALVIRDGEKCFYCSGKFRSNALQIDHRVPYEIAGNSLHAVDGINALILVCSSCNRAKSWDCESCTNFITKDTSQCLTCYWFNPDDYKHISGKRVKRINIVIDESDPAYEYLNDLTNDEIKTKLNILAQ